MPPGETLFNLDQNVTVDSAGTYRYQFDFMVDYMPELPYLNFEFNGNHLDIVIPGPSTWVHWDQNYEIAGAGVVNLHFHVSGTGLTFYIAYLDNVSLKKVG